MGYNKQIIGVALVTCISLPVVAVAQSSPSPDARPAPLEKQDTRAINIELMMLIAPIKSSADLDTFLATNHSTPLDALPTNARQEFLSSLQFSNSALGSFDYNVLENNLTPTQTYKVLALFGYQYLAPSFKNKKVNTSLDRAILSLANSSDGTKSKGVEDFGVFGKRVQMGGFIGQEDKDYRGYYCKSPGTCSPRKSDICTHNC